MTGAWTGRTVVVKHGGSAMTSPALQEAFAEDVVALVRAGVRLVVVHGGGPQISAHLARLGIGTEFRGGLRVSTPEVVQVVQMVLVGQVGPELVAAVNVHGPYAVGLSGHDAHLLRAERRDAVVDGERVDVGLVGEVVDVQPQVVLALLEQGRVPVVATAAPGADGQVYNVNADTAAAALAVALGADELVVLTDVPGLSPGWPGSTEVVPELDARALEALLPSLTGGMVPKMEACLRAVRGGVGRARVLDGRTPHALLAQAGGAPGGTVVLP